MLEFITWNVNPEIFRIGPVPVRWYGLMWALGIYLALIIVSKLFKHEKLPAEWIDKLFVYTVVGTVLGARIGHCFFYEWHLLPEPVSILGITFKYGNDYIIHPWKMFDIFHGGLAGLASHGGAIGILIALYLFNKKVSHKGFIWGLDRLVIGAAVTGACIRLGNLMNSEIYGGVTNMPWGFIFVKDPQGDIFPHHPTQIYEMIYCLLTFALTWWLYWKKRGLQTQRAYFRNLSDRNFRQPFCIGIHQAESGKF